MFPMSPLAIKEIQIDIINVQKGYANELTIMLRIKKNFKQKIRHR